MPTVLITSKSFGKQVKAPLDVLESKGYDVRLNDLGRPMTPEELIERLAECDGCIAGLDYFTADVIAAAPKLRVISRYGAGYDRVDLAAAAKAGVVVTNTPFANSDSVADLAVGLMLSAARNIALGDRTVRAGKWTNLYGVSLFEKTVGLIGLGRIGARVAARVKGFNCRVLACDPFLTPEAAAAAGVELVALDEVLRASDFISLHLPANAQTRGCIGAEQFARMKPSAILVNTARGELIDQPALLRALREKQIRAAACDAFAQEPPDPEQFAGLDNIVLSPHMGAYTEEALYNMGMGSVENLCAVFEGRTPPYVVPTPA